MLYKKMLLCCAFFINGFFAAQGYNCTVITNGRDTLTGKFIRADQTLTIHHTFTNRRLVLEPHQIHEFAITHPDGTQDVYHFIADPKTGRFKPMRRLIDGELKLFEDRVPTANAVNPGLPKGASRPPQRSVFYVATYSEDAVELNSQNWKEMLSEHLGDCPTLVENLQQKKYQFRDLPALIAAYNVCHQRELTDNSE
jgi:hypothetical protein